MFNLEGFLVAQGAAFLGLYLWKSLNKPAVQPKVSQEPQKFVMPEIKFLEEPVQRISYERIRYERIPLTKRQRFLILERDKHTCKSCGRKPPEVVLEVDHRISVFAGGGNEPSNLQTLCFDCNRGKWKDSMRL
jgi:5-methylcytosine-specific restriction endonuclease McrA